MDGGKCEINSVGCVRFFILFYKWFKIGRCQTNGILLLFDTRNVKIIRFMSIQLASEIFLKKFMSFLQRSSEKEGSDDLKRAYKDLLRHTIFYPKIFSCILVQFSSHWPLKFFFSTFSQTTTFTAIPTIFCTQITKVNHFLYPHLVIQTQIHNFDNLVLIYMQQGKKICSYKYRL